MPSALFASLGHRNFRFFFIGGIVSGSGRFFQFVALPAVIWVLTSSPGWVGFAGFAQFVPMAAVAPVAGALADRYPRRKLLLITQSLMAVTALLLAIAWWTGVRSPGAYVALAGLVGLCGGLNLPGWQAFVSELVPRYLLLNAITLNSAQFNASRLIGPMLGGITVATAGPGAAFGISAATYVAVLVALACIDAPGTPASYSAEPTRPVRNFLAVTRYIRERPGIVTAVWVVMLIGALGLPIQFQSVVLAEEVFDRGPGGFGLMLSAIGVGAIIATPAVASLGDRVARSTVSGASLIVYGLGVLGLAVAPSFALALVALAFIGAAHLALASTLNTTVQLQVDEERRAQVLAVYLMVLLAANPIGQLALGQLVELMGARLAFGLNGAVMLVAAMASAALSSLDKLDAEVSDYEPLNAPHGSKESAR